jgi:hyperosmotically inducible protein
MMKHPFTFALPAAVLACSSLVGGCVVAAVGGAAAGGYVVGKDERKAGEIARDAAITGDVKAGLIGHSGLNAFRIDVDTYRGVVTLKGNVDTTADRAEAERIARKAKGVKAVRSELAVKK